jgi:MFS family permease
MLLIPYVLITSGGYSPMQAGLAMLPLPVLMTSLSPMMGSLAARTGPRIPLTIGPVVVAAGMVLSVLSAPDSGYLTGIFPMIIVLAGGMTIAVAPLTASVLGSVEERHVAMASGFNSAVARTGGLIATALLGAVLASKGVELFDRFQMAMFASAGAALLSSIVALTTLGGVKMKNAA